MPNDAQIILGVLGVSQLNKLNNMSPILGGTSDHPITYTTFRPFLLLLVTSKHEAP